MAELSQTIVDDLVQQYKPLGKDQYIKDDLITGLQLKLARFTGRATWTFYGRIRLSKNQRVTLGRHPQMQLNEARIQATQILDQFARGIDPIEQRRKQKQEQIDDDDLEKRKRVTLGEMLDYHIGRKRLKPKTAYDYKSTINVCFPKWVDKPIQDIQEVDVEEAFERLENTGKEHQKEKAFTILNAVFNSGMNRAIGSRRSNSKRTRYVDDNPVSILKGRRNSKLIRTSRRRDVLFGADLQDFVWGLLHCNNRFYEAGIDGGPGGSVPTKNPHELKVSPIFVDFAQILLFTGIRMSEGLTLKWNDVFMDDPNPDRHYFLLHDTKNSRDHTVPISIPVANALERRRAVKENQWVFASPIKRGQHLTNPARSWVKATNWLGTKVTNHTLRRSFATVADQCGIPLEARARMLNHKVESMTESYVILNIEQLAPRFQMVADKIYEDEFDMPMHAQARFETEGRGQPLPSPDADDDRDFQ